MKIWRVRWGLVEYKEPEFEIYVWASSKEHSLVRVMQEFGGHGRITSEEVIVR